MREIFFTEKLKRKRAVHIFMIFFGCGAMYLTDTALSLSYGERSGIKIMLFFLVPLIFGFFVPQLDLFSVLRIKDREKVLPSVLMGLVIYIGLILAYMLLQGFFDLENIRMTMAENMMITKDNFIVIALYISFINSFLEEFFFRGFAFLKLKERGRGFAYTMSSLAFSLYHFSIIDGWASTLITFLGLVGLFLSGAFFCWLNEKRGNIITSYIVHMAANFAINTIGLHMFGIIRLPFLS